MWIQSLKYTFFFNFLCMLKRGVEFGAWGFECWAQTESVHIAYDISPSRRPGTPAECSSAFTCVLLFWMKENTDDLHTFETLWYQKIVKNLYSSNAIIAHTTCVIFVQWQLFGYSYSALAFAATDNIIVSLGVSQQKHINSTSLAQKYKVIQILSKYILYQGQPPVLEATIRLLKQQFIPYGMIEPQTIEGGKKKKTQKDSLITFTCMKITSLSFMLLTEMFQFN